jgi:hypothetical protein
LRRGEEKGREEKRRELFTEIPYPHRRQGSCNDYVNQGNSNEVHQQICWKPFREDR